jgi:surface protein
MLYSSSIFIQLYQYNSTNITDNYNKNILLLNSTINTINLSTISAQNGTFINFINYSGIEYNIITDGPANNYLSNVSLLKTFYISISSLNRWIAPSYYIALPLEDMIINISTTPTNYIMTLPFGGIGSLNVNWGNGVLLNYTTSPIEYIYPTTPAYYSIRISGYATSFGNADLINGYTGNNLISSISQWGTLGITSLVGALNGATTLVSVPSTISEYVNDVSYMFSNTTLFNQNISYWNTSNIINMNGMFYGTKVFNQNISAWSTLNVTNMANMFNTAEAFNQNISSWNTSKVTTMNSMFNTAKAFNQNISAWNTLNVTSMADMFYGATAFNQNISPWNTSKVANMSGMFFGATAFNQNISSLNTSSVTNMNSMFSGAVTFNQDISPWITSNVTTMTFMFNGATAFNQNISAWNVSKVTQSNGNNIFCNCPGMIARTPPPGQPPLPGSGVPLFNYSPIIWDCP